VYPLLRLLGPLLVSICRLLMLCVSDATGAGIRYSLAGPMMMFLVAGEDVSEDNRAEREVVAKVERGRGVEVDEGHGGGVRWCLCGGGIGKERQQIADQSV
jgi:hypothetical protein